LPRYRVVITDTCIFTGILEVDASSEGEARTTALVQWEDEPYNWNDFEQIERDVNDVMEIVDECSN
jgi:hypothetical protein